VTPQARPKEALSVVRKIGFATIVNITVWTLTPRNEENATLIAMLRSRMLTVLTLVLAIGIRSMSAQVGLVWPPQQRIPGFATDTQPPILVADRHRTVHAFFSQTLAQANGPDVRGIMYNQWSLGEGWTVPVNILLSPFKNDARVLDAYIDAADAAHLIFWGGDSTVANIYYSSAPLADAGSSRGWSEPALVTTNAGDPEAGGFDTSQTDGLEILFSGQQNGNGLYTTASSDQGHTWSKPALVTNTNDPNELVSGLKIFVGVSGRTTAIWNEANTAGQGRIVYFMQKGSADQTWSQPAMLAEATVGYGTNTPAVIEYHDTVFAFYNLGGTIWQRTSADGQTWSVPARIFARHVGVNGNLALVVDGNDQLLMFFGQRISGSPDIHGMWHSEWLQNNWTEPEAVVSGPRQMSGMTSFDPYGAEAAVSQGNVILVTWRTDPGNGPENENGVWYSYAQLDAPETAAIPTMTRQPTPAGTAAIATPLPVVTPTLPIGGTLAPQSLNNPTQPSATSDPLAAAILGVSIAALFVLSVGGAYYFNRRRVLE
jgi:hypothetical protein